MTQLTDVLIVGAGISGINAAYRIRQARPDLTVTILEARDTMAGTWDLFRYPGVRSDSDIFTLAFPFRPWQGRDAIVGGEEIREYVLRTARETGIDQLIRYGTRVTSADWNSAEGRWHVDGYSARFLVLCTGYYDYENPHDPEIPGTSDFAGEIVHPQLWPEDLDYTGRRVVVVGSGATAVTVVPAMAGRAEHVTMLQRTPTYVLARPRRDVVANALRKLLPAGTAHRVARAKNILGQWLLYRLCRRYPDRMRALLRKGVVATTGSAEIADRDFAPPYAPWDQRLCIAPDGDLFTAIRNGSASVVTASIDRFVPEGVRLEDGRVLPADLVVTATGLRLKLLGGIDVRRDGAPVDLSETVTWHGTMLSGLPNLAVCIGYINLSWTVRADMTARLIARILSHLGEAGMDVVEPVAPADLGELAPFMDMQSGYLRRSAHLMPRAAGHYPWSIRQDVMADARATNHADLTDGLCWSKVSQGVRA
ncbi:flavin-containing monooxygenase [Actinoplanes regularis]|uniref:flavin-containing monooxygenase n=1 Tax=Actinoplanes regularis TaxID=52697 RepID=UPI00249F9EBC|nr:NAD(P)/FAD-dependent oxidoreductase [Actinoplanes regularis]GLW33753.1 monooxygenase flavin-binding family protein [Actinoplanes regularis]